MKRIEKPDNEEMQTNKESVRAREIIKAEDDNQQPLKRKDENRIETFLRLNISTFRPQFSAGIPSQSTCLYTS